jgi:hypothetical protein
MVVRVGRVTGVSFERVVLTSALTTMLTSIIIENAPSTTSGRRLARQLDGTR